MYFLDVLMNRLILNYSYMNIHRMYFELIRTQPLTARQYKYLVTLVTSTKALREICHRREDVLSYIVACHI